MLNGERKHKKTPEHPAALCRRAQLLRTALYKDVVLFSHSHQHLGQLQRQARAASVPSIASVWIAILSRLSAESCVSPREAGNRAVASSPLQCNRQFATQREKERSSCTISQQVVEKLEAETPLPVPRCPQDAHPRFSTLLQPCFTPLACPQQRKHVPAPSQLCSVPSSMQELKCLLVFRSELAPHAG